MGSIRDWLCIAHESQLVCVRHWTLYDFFRLCFSLSSGVKVKCHLDMDAKTLSFTVGEKLFKDLVVDLPAEVWPAVDMRSAGLSAKFLEAPPPSAEKPKATPEVKAAPAFLGFAGASVKFDSSLSAPVELSENDTVGVVSKKGASKSCVLLSVTNILFYFRHCVRFDFVHYGQARVGSGNRELLWQHAGYRRCGGAKARRQDTCCVWLARWWHVDSNPTGSD
jgi:hypothetical protein